MFGTLEPSWLLVAHESLCLFWLGLVPLSLSLCQGLPEELSGYGNKKISIYTDFSAYDM